MAESVEKKTKFSPALILVLVAIALFFWSWHQWADVQVDWGELAYFLWQRTEGKIPFKDIAYYHGPFSAYVGPWIFQLFGSTMMGLAWANLLIVIGIALMIFSIFRKITDQITGLIVSLVFLIVFAFAQYNTTANYNFILPYKLEALHGTFICILAIYAFQQILSEKKNYIYLFGVSLGLLALTSTEFLLVSLAYGIVFGIWFWRNRKAYSWNFLFKFLAAYFSPLVMFFLVLTINLGMSSSLKFLFQAAILPLEHKDLVQNSFFREKFGSNLIQLFFKQIIVWALLGLILSIFILISFLLKNKNKIVAQLVALLLAGVLCVAALETSFVSGFYQRLILLVPGAIILSLLHAFYTWRQPNHFPGGQYKIIQLFWLVFSIVLISKIFFSPRIDHYGFYLAMPAVLYCVSLLIYSFSRLSVLGKFNSEFLRTSLICFVAIFVMSYFFASTRIYQRKDYIVGSGSDAIATWPDSHSILGPLLNDTIRWISENTKPSDKVLNLPSLTLINYLAKREQPIPYSYKPFEVIFHGEAVLLEALQRNPPQYISLFNMPNEEFGLGDFGKSEQYGGATMRWVRENYKVVKTFGDENFNGDGAAVQVLERNNNRE